MFDFLPSCLRRHKKKLLFLGGVVGGIAFLNSYLKKKFIEWEAQRVGELSDKFKKATHFENTMLNCDTTFTSITRKVREAVVQEVEVDIVLENIKQNPPEEKENKIKLWEELKVLVFTQVIGEMYAQCILCILLRVQMCILSGYIFATRNSSDNTTAQQNKYMSRIQDFLLNGMTKLLSQVRQVCSCKLKKYDLGDLLRLQDIEHIICSVTEDVTKALPDISCLLVSPESSQDDDFLQTISSETKDVLDCDDIKEVLDACVLCGVSYIMDQMSECYAYLSNNNVAEFVNLNEYAAHLAKLIPVLRNTYKQQEVNGEIGPGHRLIQIEKLNDFAANIYEAFSYKR